MSSHLSELKEAGDKAYQKVLRARDRLQDQIDDREKLEVYATLEEEALRALDAYRHIVGHLDL